MLRTYEGVLNNNRIEWTGEAPSCLRSLRVHVTVLEEEAEDEEQGERMATALSHLAESNAFSRIDDPRAWQRRQRTDRPLPGRKQGG